jgi:hypothetical protein
MDNDLRLTALRRAARLRVIARLLRFTEESKFALLAAQELEQLAQIHDEPLELMVRLEREVVL